MPDILHRSVGHLGTALRLVLFMPTSAATMRSGFGELVLLATLSIAADSLLDFATAGEQAWFYGWGLVSAIAEWTVFGVLVTALWSRARAFRTTDALTAVAAVSSLLAMVFALIFLANSYLRALGLLSPGTIAWASFILAWLLLGWCLLAFWRIGHAIADRRRWLSGLGLVAVSVGSSYILPSTSMFMGTQTDLSRSNLLDLAANWLQKRPDTNTAAGVEGARIDVERTYYRQTSLLDASMAGLEPSPNGRPAMYFVGFAGYSEQSVFRSELSRARNILDERFATRGRSLLLVNNRETVEELPLASVSNLKVTLERLGRHMDKEKDILFLFLTSHGSELTLSVSFPGFGLNGFGLNGLSPGDLRAMLDRSGIVNRVIVISACHSGSFIPALEDANSLIMVAARADRTSFGCADNREWTYFGDALFNHALRETRSLVAGFHLAKLTVGAWEKEQNLTASEPQISIGNNIGAKVDAWETTLGDKQAQPQESHLPAGGR